MDGLEKTRKLILEAALGHVAQYGWSAESVSRAARDQGLASLAHGLFSRVVSLSSCTLFSILTFPRFSVPGTG